MKQITNTIINIVPFVGIALLFAAKEEGLHPNIPAGIVICFALFIFGRARARMVEKRN